MIKYPEGSEDVYSLDNLIALNEGQVVVKSGKTGIYARVWSLLLQAVSRAVAPFFQKCR